MEHPESPRRATSEHAAHEPGLEGLSSRRFQRFVTPPSMRRLALSRVALAALAGVGVLGLIFLVGSFALRSLPGYLHRQPVYQFSFRDIVLDPVPPPCFRGGPRVFLERVRNAAREPEQQSALDVDLEKLANDFRRSPWVQKVVRVERGYPNRVVVRLIYREPVARVSFDRDRQFVLDGEGVILPLKELDPGACGPLIPLYGVKQEPESPTPGEVWKRLSRSGDPLEVHDLVVAEAALAAYIRSVQVEIEHGPGQNLTFEITATALGKADDLWLKYGHRYFRWGEAPGRELTDPLRATAKWETLRDWLLESPAPAGTVVYPPEYYDIGPNGIQPRSKSRSGS